MIFSYFFGLAQESYQVDITVGLNSKEGPQNCDMSCLC